MSTLYEQDVAKVRGALYIGARATGNYEILKQHRPLVDAVRLALGMLERMRPGDETLKNTALMFRMAHRKVTLSDGKTEYLRIDRAACNAALERIDELYGPFDDTP